MSKGKIEKEDIQGFKMVKERLFKTWDNFKGINSLQIYLDNNRTISGFLWESFHATKTKLGDGAGMPGEVNWYAMGHDDHIETALKSIWQQYTKERK